ncbi:double zinc ribbon domain-containing protein [Methanocaldococcus indicus]|uniref:zinc ribbon domain-containing protein n=1 Tax=Methanocaldococcus indicus TaxID=213231 RepID=UPI003C6DA1AB
MVYIIPLSEEEKMSIIAGLRSSVPGTRLITLRKLQEICENRPEAILYMDAYDKNTLNEIITLLNHIIEYDPDEVIRREAMITLEKLKKALGAKFTTYVPICNNCKNPVDLGWEYCANCGAEIDKMVFEEEVRRCKNCNKYIFDTWLYCTHCGVKLKEEVEEELRCPNCKRPIQPDWLVCPYCGHRLKRKP